MKTPMARIWQNKVVNDSAELHSVPTTVSKHFKQKVAVLKSYNFFVL
jgi:hypothetical protein